MYKFLKVLLMPLLLLIAGSVFAQGNKYVLGILPVDDESSESLTEFLPPGLTMLLYNHIREMPNVEPVLLGPGGLYEPDSRDWIQEYGKKAHVDAVLISRLLPTIKVNNHKRRLVFAIEVMDVKTGTVTPKVVDDSVEVETVDLFTTLSTSYISSNANVGFLATFFKSPAEFEKQRLGSASMKLVNWAESSLQTTLPTLATAPSGIDSSAVGPACAITFRVRFMTKHSIAKGYSVFANDTDQSSAVNDGIANFSIPSGPLVIRVQIPDAPYGLPVQKLYQTSTVLDCAGPDHTLSMEIGAAGEALLHWE